MQMLLTPEQESTMRKLSQYITDGNEAWYHSPLWFKELGEGIYECIKWDELPENIKDMYLMTKGIKTPG